MHHICRHCDIYLYRLALTHMYVLPHQFYGFWVCSGRIIKHVQQQLPEKSLK